MQFSNKKECQLNTVNTHTVTFSGRKTNFSVICAVVSRKMSRSGSRLSCFTIRLFECRQCRHIHFTI